MAASALRTIFAWRRLLGWGAVVLAVGLPGSAVLAKVRARLPDPWNANRHIVVVVDAPAPPAGTPLVRMEPSLAVIGVVEGPAGEEVATTSPGAAPPGDGQAIGAGPRLRVSIFPEAQGLLRDDSRLELRETSPDLLEIVSRHFTAARRAEIAARARRFYAAHEEALDAALARVKVLAERDLGVDELGRKLFQDQLLRDAVSGAIQRDVIDPIDWNAVVDQALASDAADSTAELLKHAGPLSSTWAGLRRGYGERWSRAFGGASEEAGKAGAGASRAWAAIQEGDVDEALLEGGGTLAEIVSGKGLSRLARDPAGWAWDHVLALTVPDGDAFKRGATERIGDNLRRALPRHKDRLAKDFLALGQDLSQRNALADRAGTAVRGLSQDARLRQEILARHGPEAAARVERFLGSLGTDAELQRLLRGALTSGLDLLAGILRELALDDAGRGPNPLLVAFVREKLRGKTSPTLILREVGSGDPVSEGQAFPARRP